MKAKFCAEIIVIFMIGTGCATYGEIENDFGKSYKMATQGQILNPAASQNLKPVTGLSGEAAELTMEKYIQSFSSDSKKTDQKKSSAPVNAGTAGGGQDVYGK